MIRLILAAAAALSLTSAASAQSSAGKEHAACARRRPRPRERRGLQRAGYNVTATVVDRAGVVRAVLRADNAGPHTVDAARRKAFTSASTRLPTSTVAENVQKNPARRSSSPSTASWCWLAACR